MEMLWQDLRYAVRTGRKAPGFTLVALLTLALGIGANTAVFSILKAAVLDPLPFPQPDRLAQIWETNRRRDARREPISPHNFTDWRSQSRAFDEMAAYEYEAFALTGAGEPERIAVNSVTPGFFRVLGVKPVLGRDFLPEEAARSANRVVILRYETWQRRFASDARILGHELTLDDEKYVSSA
jgi:putative ABC transport system permease protein